MWKNYSTMIHSSPDPTSDTNIHYKYNIYKYKLVYTNLNDLPVKGKPLIGEGLTDNGAYLPISLP